jgi:CRISPR-associated protein Cmr6
MTVPLYSNAQALTIKPNNAHAGLWFERFFNGFDKNKDWQIPKPDDKQDAKKDWIKTVTGQQGDKAKLENFAKRQHALVTALQGQSRCYTTDWHFVTGMGNPHPVENGFSWHPTLAVPYLAGSAVKGLVRAWVELEKIELLAEVKNGNDLPEEKQTKLKEINNRLLRWFGTEDKEKKEKVAEQAGDFIFFDAIPHTPPTLLCDIMTPHMGDWYESGNNPLDNRGNIDPSRIPADWHEPVPVPFLAVKNAQFIFSIAVRKPNNDAHLAELPAIFEALNKALLWLGAGAKTAAGYGYMDNKPEDNKQFEQKKNEWAKKERVDAEDDKRKQELNDKVKNLSPAAQNYFKDENKQKWETDKDNFLQNGEIEKCLSELEVNPDADILADIVRLLNTHIAGLLDYPDKVKGRKAKPVYSDRQQKIAQRIKALQS